MKLPFQQFFSPINNLLFGSNPFETPCSRAMLGRKEPNVCMSLLGFILTPMSLTLQLVEGEFHEKLIGCACRPQYDFTKA
jgi:hypothetical protein